MVEKLDEVRDIGEFEERQVPVVGVLNLEVDEHDEADQQVKSDQGTQADKSLLADDGPWRVADAKKDGLQSDA